MQGELESAKRAVADMTQLSSHSKSSARGGARLMVEEDDVEEERAERELQILSRVAELQKTMRPYQVSQ
jgi:hypothetical protein